MSALQNVTFKWDARRELAAVLLAADEKTDEQIAAECNVARNTLATWKLAPEFQSRIAQHLEVFRTEILRRSFADKARRVRALDTVAGALLNQLQRAEYQTIVKVTEDGEHIYGFDKDRLREFREYLDDIAIEVGDRAQDKTGGATVVVKVYTDPRMDNPIEADWHDAPPARSSADA